MAPYVQIDESRKNIGGRQAQALVLDTEHAVLIRIEKDKSRKTMEGAFWMVLNRPFVADMYRGGYTFGGEFQSCFVHVNHKSEGLAIRHGIDSFEYVLYVMMRGIYHDAKAAAARTLEMAGGQAAQSACDIGAAVRTVPGLAEHVESSRSDLLKRLGKVVAAPFWFRQDTLQNMPQKAPGMSAGWHLILAMHFHTLACLLMDASIMESESHAHV